MEHTPLIYTVSNKVYLSTDFLSNFKAVWIEYWLIMRAPIIPLICHQLIHSITSSLFEKTYLFPWNSLKGNVFLKHITQQISRGSKPSTITACKPCPMFEVQKSRFTTFFIFGGGVQFQRLKLLPKGKIIFFGILGRKSWVSGCYLWNDELWCGGLGPKYVIKWMCWYPSPLFK